MVPAENLSSVLTIHVRLLTTACNFSSRGPDALFGLPRREGGVMGVMEEQSGAGTRAKINGGLCPVQQPSA